MAELKIISIDRIHTGDRLRRADRLHVAALARSIDEVGLIEPVVVRHTPNKGKGTTPYVLVAGLHRIEATKKLGWSEIPAVVSTLPALKAEIHENLIRNELSVLERADYVLALRELFEAEHGAIRRGGTRVSDPISETRGEQRELGSLWSEELGRIADRLGVSDRQLRKWQTLKTILPALRALLHGSQISDELATLMKLAKLAPEIQSLIVVNVEAGKPIEAAVTDFLPTEEPLPEGERILGYMATYVPRLNEAACLQVLDMMAERHAAALAAWFGRRGDEL